MDDMILSFKRLTRLCLTESNKMVMAVIFSVISFSTSIVPYYMVYRVVIELTEGNPMMSNIIDYAVITFVSIVIRITFFAVATSTSHKVAFGVLYKLRIQMAKKLLTLPLGYFSKKDLGATKKTINEDVEKIEAFIAHNVPEIIGAMTLPVITTIFLFFMDWRMALATIAVIPLIFFFYGMALKNNEELLPRYNVLLVKMNSSIIEYANGMQVIKAFGLTGVTYKKLSEACEDYGKFAVDMSNAGAKYFNVIEILIVSGVATIFPVGLLLYLDGSLSMGMFILFLLMGMGYSQPLMNLMGFMGLFYQIVAGEKEIYSLLNEESLRETKTAQKLDNYRVCFKDVSFSYEERQVLDKVSFVAEQNEITALIGPSGAGKTTIARLIPRFWDVDAGKIEIGGINIKNIPFADLMDMVSFVFQDVFLFNMSIRDNIAFGKDNANESEIIEAAKAAMCHGFITKLPNGYDTFAGQRGTKLSGGEKQRIALARAILKDAPIVVFDEATSATDPENEDKIQEAVSKLIKGKTVIVIAHNLSTVVEANQILLVSDGHVTSRGTHLELLNDSTMYKKMWDAHLRSNELSTIGGEESA